MLHFKSIDVFQFKNYLSRQFHFTHRIVGICGPNGIGKTNLLDAIHYLCFTKSYFTRTEIQNATVGQKGFRIEGFAERSASMHRLVAVLRETGKKEFQVDDQAYDRLSKHIGRFPCVVIAPDDVQLVSGASDERRRFLDALISQLQQKYLQNLIDYNRVLQQRNGHLRAENRRPDPRLLDVYDEQLVQLGTELYTVRKEFLATLLPEAARLYRDIAGKEEKVSLHFRSQLHQCSFADLLQNCREKDILLQRTTMGIHRDDIEIFFGTEAFKIMASQGQRKSLLFALKMAEFNMLREANGFAPVLLLDDVFEKLDAARMHNLLEKVCLQSDGQIFITDTHRERITNHLAQLNTDFDIIDLH